MDLEHLRILDVAFHGNGFLLLPSIVGHGLLVPGRRRLDFGQLLLGLGARAGRWVLDGSQYRRKWPGKNRGGEKRDARKPGFRLISRFHHSLLVWRGKPEQVKSCSLFFLSRCRRLSSNNYVPRAVMTRIIVAKVRRETIAVLES